jgi:glyoxylase-like metal-dependent hydrolase (beta-lactamase superfamily II)
MSQVKVTIFQAGYCSCPEFMAIQGGRPRNVRFPAMFALLEHPRFGLTLFDTGYSYNFFKETRRLPNRLYRLLTPVSLKEEELAVKQLGVNGVRAGDIERVFISHFHADHVAALDDFPKARYIHTAQAYAAVKPLHGLRAVTRAYLPGLVPGDFERRSQPLRAEQTCRLPPELLPFQVGYDLFGDESVVAVELPGHAAGQAGLICRDESGQRIFFCADAAWLGRSIREERAPRRGARLLWSEPERYGQTLHGLHQVAQNATGVRIIPSHCAETLAAWQAHA